MSQALLHDKLYSVLLSQIENMIPGTKLPTVRKIMKDHNVSLSTVNRALGNLRVQGYIKSQTGNGIFACHPETVFHKGIKQVDIVFFGYESSLNDDGYICDLFHSLSQIYGSKDIGVRIKTISLEDTVEKQQTEIDKLLPRAVITVNLTNFQFLEYLDKKNIPYVNLTPNIPRRVTNSICINNKKVARLWLDCLTDNGHSKIAFLHGINELWYFRDMHERERAFYHECAKHNIVPDNELVVYGGYSPEEAYKAIEKLLDKKHELTAIIVNDHIASGVYRCLIDRGLIVGRDISVIGMDDIKISSHLLSPLTTINISREKLACEAMAMMEKAICSNNTIKNVIVEPELVQRNSIINLNTIKE